MKNGMIWNEKAVSPVLGAVLMLAIGVTILTTVQLNFVPVWNAQEELDHMKKMYDDFKELKSGIESGVQSGTTLSKPLSMGFKYSPKMFVYNPRESAFASLDIRDNVWAEVRYNEMLPDGMDDAASIRNLTSSTITYSLQGAQNYNAFIYEQGLIRRSGSNYTSGSQTVLANGTIYLLSVKPWGSEKTAGVEKLNVNIYPTSQQKNSVIGKNVWLILHTNPDYVTWWKSKLEKEGGIVKKADNGIVIAYVDSMVIKMGEAYISPTASVDNAPSHAPPYRLVKITPDNTYLPVDGTTSLAVEVQDYYNNPVPNVLVNFRINDSRIPTNAYMTASLVQNSSISGADGRAYAILKTNGPGMYYIDAYLSDQTNRTTFVYPASSQSGSIGLEYTGSGSDLYTVTATLKDGTGAPWSGQNIVFATGEGTITNIDPNTLGDGTMRASLNTTDAQGIKITDIKTANVSTNSALITWDTVNTITVTANQSPYGYIFNYIDIPTKVNTTGCVKYGILPEIYTTTVCDNLSGVSSHSVNLSNLSSRKAYYFIVNSSRQPSGPNVDSTEYIFVTNSTADTTPPGNVTGLAVESTGPLHITWKWTDPTDADFDRVNVYIDGAPISPPVLKGMQRFNATYLMPNSTHTITLETVDTSGNTNPYLQSDTNKTQSLYTFLIDYVNATGTVMDFDRAKSDSDGGQSALFNESLISGLSARDNYTNVTGNTTTVGNISNWQNMQTELDGGAFANLSEGGSVGTPGGRINITANVIGATDTTGDTLSALQANDTSGASPGAVNTGDGWYTVIKNRVMFIDGFDTSGIIGTITSATLRMQYSVQAGGYSGTNNVTWGRQGGALNATNIRPVNGQVDVISSYDLFAQGIDTVAELSTLNIEFTNNDGGGSQSVSFDYVWIDVTYSGIPATYSMNITTYTDPVPVDTNYYLEIRYRIDTNETGYNVSVFNGTGWTYKGSLTSNSWTVFNQSLDILEYNSGNVSVRYIDQDPSGTSRGNLSIDYQRIHGYSPGTPAGYNLEVITNTTDIPQSNYSELQIKYNLTVPGDNFTVEVWNGTSGWSYKTTLNGSGVRYYNYTLTPGELIPNGAFSPGTVSDLPKFYARVRYMDEDPTKQGRLYLDYQRVYSW